MVRKIKGFQKCPTCEQLRAAIKDCVDQGIITADVSRQRNVHIEFFGQVERAYRTKSELTKYQPTQFLSIVVNAADQTKVSLRRFVRETKEQRG